MTVPLELLRRDLARAVRAGEPTAAIRDAIAAAEQEAARQTALRDRQALDEASASARAVDIMVAARRAQVAARIAATIPVMTEQPVPDLAVFPEHRAAVVQLETARTAVAQVEPRVAATAAEVGHLSDQISTLQADRSAIAARRRQGEHRRDDAGAIALIDLDLADLEEQHSRAVAAASAAARDREQRAGAVAEAAARLDRVEQGIVLADAVARLEQLDNIAAEAVKLLAMAAAHMDSDVARAVLPRAVERAQALDARMLKTMDLVATLDRRTGRNGVPIWSASTALRTGIRDLAARRGEL